MTQIFVTGISTNVGKTIAAAIITEALKADYWKPIQSGDLEQSDSERVANLISNKKTVIHKSSYSLKAPLSPHAAAKLEGITIDSNTIEEPNTENHLVIEGAGGILTPLNDYDTILDLIMPNYKVIVVSENYLGSINHSLLTIYWLQQRGYDVAVLFNGDENKDSESLILNRTGASLIGRIAREDHFDKSIIKKYAEQWRATLLAL